MTRGLRGVCPQANKLTLNRQPQPRPAHARGSARGERLRSSPSLGTAQGHRGVSLKRTNRFDWGRKRHREICRSMIRVPTGFASERVCVAASGAELGARDLPRAKSSGRASCGVAASGATKRFAPPASPCWFLSFSGVDTDWADQFIPEDRALNTDCIAEERTNHESVLVGNGGCGWFGRHAHGGRNREDN